jgi:hypothetical protein
MSDLWVEGWVDGFACSPITVNVHGDGDGHTELLCWICVTPWPCDTYRAGDLNVVQRAAIPDSENP